MAGRDNVLLLTRGVALPVDPLLDQHLEVIVDAISSAWQTMLADPTGKETSGSEREVNASLVSRLKIALRGRSRFRTLVHQVERGIERHSYDGSNLELRPDLSFLLTRRSEFPLIGECKIIDHAGRKTIDLYNVNGVDRFVLGQYAWFANQGFMIAYVRDNTNAITALQNLDGSTPYPWPAVNSLHFKTRHNRNFCYIDRDSADAVPGPIDLVHVWLR